MKTLSLLAALSLCAPVSGEMSVGAAFEQALDQAGVVDRSELPAAPKAGQGASLLKVEDFTPSNASYLPEQYFKTRTVMTAHVWDGEQGESLTTTAYDRPGFMARFTDGAFKYQFIFMKVYKRETLAIVNLVETDHGMPDESGSFIDKIETQSFLVPPGAKSIDKQIASASLKGSDQGDGVLRYDEDDGRSTVSARVVNQDRSEDDNVTTTGMSTTLNERFTLTGADTAYRHDPTSQAEMLKSFPEPVQAFLMEFARLHWTAVFAGKILSDCLAKAGGNADACAAQQADYDEAHAARSDYWSKTLKAQDVAALKPTEPIPAR